MVPYPVHEIMEKYSFNIIYSEEDEGYVATIPEFPGLSAYGETPEEAIEEAQIVLKGFIEVYKEDGCKIPAPHTFESYSGQTRLRLPKNLHAKLSKQAEREGWKEQFDKALTSRKSGDTDQEWLDAPLAGDEDWE
jgi:predicted RNase H-like HicB family nuclease